MIEIIKKTVTFRERSMSGSFFFAIWLIFGICIVINAQSTNETKYYQSAGTAKMAKLLRSIYDAQDFKVDPNKSAERAAYYRSMFILS